MHATTLEGINALMQDWYELNDGRLLSPENKPSARGDTRRPIYKGGWVWNGIDHRKAYGFR